MPYDPQNPFARILRDELPSIRVYEDDHTVAMMDIMPQAEGHVLILPKEAAAELFDLSEEAAAACIRTTRKVAIAVKAVLNPPGTLLAASIAARCSSSVIQRTNSVGTAPGCTENARMPCGSPRASSASAKSAFAVLDCP